MNTWCINHYSSLHGTFGRGLLTGGGLWPGDSQLCSREEIFTLSLFLEGLFSFVRSLSIVDAQHALWRTFGHGWMGLAPHSLGVAHTHDLVTLCGHYCRRCCHRLTSFRHAMSVKWNNQSIRWPNLKQLRLLSWPGDPGHYNTVYRNLAARALCPAALLRFTPGVVVSLRFQCSLLNRRFWRHPT